MLANIWPTFSRHLTSWENSIEFVGEMLAKCWRNVGEHSKWYQQLHLTFRQLVGEMLVKCWLSVG